MDVQSLREVLVVVRELGGGGLVTAVVVIVFLFLQVIKPLHGALSVWNKRLQAFFEEHSEELFTAGRTEKLVREIRDVVVKESAGEKRGLISRLLSRGKD